MLQTQYCRVEGNDKCVLATTVEFVGVPYSDTFAVEIRWVATRAGECDINIKVGVEVDFKKSTFLRAKIRAGTLEETLPVHKGLFEAAKAACSDTSGVEEPCEVGEPGADELEKVHPPHAFDWNLLFLACGVLVVVVLFFRFVISGAREENSAAENVCIANDALANLNARLLRMESEWTAMRTTLDEIRDILKESRSLEK